MALTPKQKAFVQEYLVDLNATQAAKRAGYSKKTAGKIGQENLTKPEIATAIQEAMAKRSARTEITADSVLRELALIGFSNMADFAEWGGRSLILKDSTELNEDLAKCVSQVSITETENGKNIRIKLHDKLSALEKIARHLGMFDEQKESEDIPIENVVIELPDGTTLDNPFPEYTGKPLDIDGLH